jgi:hypothetical protein
MVSWSNAMTSLQKIRRRKKQCHDPKKAEGTFGLEGIVHFAYKLNIQQYLAAVWEFWVLPAAPPQKPSFHKTITLIHTEL